MKKMCVEISSDAPADEYVKFMLDLAKHAELYAYRVAITLKVNDQPVFLSFAEIENVINQHLDTSRYLIRDALHKIVRDAVLETLYKNKIIFTSALRAVKEQI